MTSFDDYITTFVNGFARSSLSVDVSIVLLSMYDVFKGGVVLPFLWWAWFRDHENKKHDRETVLATIVGSLLAIVTARVLAVSLPFRARPINNPDLDLQLPYGMAPRTLEAWSSFPSDHATFFFALVWGIWIISRVAGVLVGLYTLTTICLFRVFMGLHYPTDILVGAIIGVAIASLVNLPKVRARISSEPLRWEERYPGVFYAGFFFLSYQLATLFNDLRRVGGVMFQVLFE